LKRASVVYKLPLASITKLCETILIYPNQRQKKKRSSYDLNSWWFNSLACLEVRIT
jgi:hypothetical protein